MSIATFKNATDKLECTWEGDKRVRDFQPQAGKDWRKSKCLARENTSDEQSSGVEFTSEP